MKKYLFIGAILFSYILVTISSCKTHFSQEVEAENKKRNTKLKLNKFGLPNSVIPYKQWLIIKPEIKNWKMKYASYKDDLVKFNVGVFDKNKNGLYSDINEDILFIGNATDSTFEYTPAISSRASLLKKTNNFLDYNGLYLYKIIYVNKNDLIIEKVKRKDSYTDLLFYNKLPNVNLKFLNSKKTINLTSFINGKPTKFIFFTTWCIHCWEEMDLIYDKKLYNSYNIVSLFSGGNINQTLSIIKDKKYPWIFLESKVKINKIFSQNGFPYIVNFNEEGFLLE